MSELRPARAERYWRALSGLRAIGSSTRGPEAAGLVFARRLVRPELEPRSHGGIPCFSNAQRGR
jgi:hypothetical protein